MHQPGERLGRFPSAMKRVDHESGDIRKGKRPQRDFVDIRCTLVNASKPVCQRVRGTNLVITVSTNQQDITDLRLK